MTKKNSHLFELLILGSSSAIPSDDRFPSAQLLNMREQLFLIDCGEATQNRLWSFKVRWSKISHICISHLHGDHVFGLPGLITSFSHLQRKEPLTICGPEGIQDFLEGTLRHSRAHLNFEIHYLELDHRSGTKFYDDGLLSITSFPLNHRVPTIGYVFKVEEHYRKLNIEKISQYAIPVSQYKKVVAGESISDMEGNVYTADEFSAPVHYLKSYAYCSDTRYDESIISFIKDVDVLYHETTYLEALAHKAQETGHSTAHQAAIMAKKSGVGRLITGHYSSRYHELNVFLQECQSVFPNTILGKEGLLVQI